MESNDANSFGLRSENRSRSALFQFSLLGYLTTIVLTSIVLSFSGSILTFASISMGLGFLIATGHIVSEWILRPVEVRRTFLTNGWFWIALGCGFGVATISAIAAQYNTSDFENAKPSFVSIAFRAAVAMLGFYIAIRCWWHSRPLVAPKSNHVRT
jgi:hypothetical protein